MRRILCGWLLVLALIDVASAQDAAKPILALDAGGHTALVKKVLFTPDGSELITVSEDKTIRLWGTAAGEPLRVLRPPIGLGDDGMLYAAAISPDGKRLAVGGYHPGVHPIYVISLETDQIVGVLKGHGNIIYYLAFSPDGKRLISGSEDNTARVWDVGRMPQGESPVVC